MPKTLHDPAARAAILARTDALRPDAPRRWGRMNAHQAVCHMADGYRMALGDRPIRPIRNPLFLTAGRWVALHTPLPWPKGAPTSPKADQVKGGGTPPGDFHADVAELKALTERFAAADPAGLHPHVIFGRLSRGEWGRWAWRHADHHLRQFGV
jgi:hypothetical protein